MRVEALDLRVIQCMLERKTFNSVISAVPLNAISSRVKRIIEDMRDYYIEFDTHDKIIFNDFQTWAFTARNQGLDDEEKTLYKRILKRAVQTKSDTLSDEIIVGELHKLKMATDLGNIIVQWKDGSVPDIYSKVSTVLTDYVSNVQATNDAWIRTDIGDILTEMLDDSGISWRLDVLNDSMRGLRPGDMGIIAGRPDKGKTTFFASELTHMAKQIPEDTNIIWLNNEGMGKRIIPRLYQSALNAEVSDLARLNEAGTLKQAYIDEVGRADKIRIYDIHNMYISQLERIFEQANPYIVVVDMLDHVYGSGGADMRTDLQLEEKYKWFRACCVRYGFIGLASSQISVEGDDLQFPPLGSLKDSKTGKQGACDFQLMIGALNNEALRDVRYLSLPKNKLRKEGTAGDPRAQVNFFPQRARYEDIGSLDVNPDELLI